MTDKFSGVVLAGGRSRRMGRDKCELVWQQQSLLCHMQQLLTQAGAARVWVAGPQAGDNTLADSGQNLGPLGGLLSLVEHCDDGLYVVVPVDMPLLAATIITPLIEALAKSLPHQRLACYLGTMLPAALRLDSQSRMIIEQYAAQQGAARSLRSLFRGLNGVSLPPPSTQKYRLANCNTPAQWQQAKVQASGF